MSQAMKEYYQFRQELRKLYKNDVNNNGDLCGQILHVRDKYRSVNSIDVSIQDYSIGIDIEPGTSQNKQNEILSKVVTEIKKFISDNKESIDKDIHVEDYLSSKENVFCDIVTVGNSIKINL